MANRYEVQTYSFGGVAFTTHAGWGSYPHIRHITVDRETWRQLLEALFLPYVNAVTSTWDEWKHWVPFDDTKENVGLWEDMLDDDNPGPEKVRVILDQAYRFAHPDIANNPLRPFPRAPYYWHPEAGANREVIEALPVIRDGIDSVPTSTLSRIGDASKSLHRASALRPFLEWGKGPEIDSLTSGILQALGWIAWVYDYIDIPEAPVYCHLTVTDAILDWATQQEVTPLSAATLKTISTIRSQRDEARSEYMRLSELSTDEQITALDDLPDHLKVQVLQPGTFLNSIYTGADSYNSREMPRDPSSKIFEYSSDIVRYQDMSADAKRKREALSRKRKEWGTR